MGLIQALLGLSIVGASVLLVPSHAQVMQRAIAPAGDCLQFLHTDVEGLIDWRDLVEVEHCDRMKRLQRITELNSVGQNVAFYDGSVAASQLPPGIDIRIPLLRVVFPERIFFDTDSSRLRPEAWAIVRIVSESMRHEPPDVAVFVAGHADERGSNSYNYNLSIDRSNALAEAILASGVNVASVWRVGFGEDMPLIAGSNEAAWGQNRRIEFLFSARPEPIKVWLESEQLDLTCQAQSARVSNLCKLKLEPKVSYEALEVVSTDATTLEMARSIATLSPESDISKIEAIIGSVAVEAKTEKVIINPRPPRKIHIYPVNNTGQTDD